MEAITPKKGENENSPYALLVRRRDAPPPKKKEFFLAKFMVYRADEIGVVSDLSDGTCE